MKSPSTSAKKTLDAESPAVHLHLNLLQSLIGRMATNSANCKSWCVTVTSGMLVLLLNHDEWHFAWLAFLPLALFLLLDAYYLALEQSFRERFQTFCQDLHEGKAATNDLFNFAPRSRSWRIFSSFHLSILSPSVLPFYVVLGLGIWAAVSCFSVTAVTARP